MKIEEKDIRNDVLDEQSNPELKFLLEFELQKNILIKVPFYYDCSSSELFLTEINLATMKVERRPCRADAVRGVHTGRHNISCRCTLDRVVWTALVLS